MLKLQILPTFASSNQMSCSLLEPQESNSAAKGCLPFSLPEVVQLSFVIHVSVRIKVYVIPFPTLTFLFADLYSTAGIQ